MIRPALVAILLIVTVLLTVSGPLHAESADKVQARAYQLKAAFLYKFTRFADWTSREDRPAKPILICIQEPDPFGNSIDRIAQINDPLNEEVTIARVQSVEAMRPCHILYLRPSEDLPVTLSNITGLGIMTVSDAKDFARQGGIVELYDDRVNVFFKINQHRAKEVIKTE
jgi:hypothetical protein